MTTHDVAAELLIDIPWVEPGDGWGVESTSWPRAHEGIERFRSALKAIGSTERGRRSTDHLLTCSQGHDYTATHVGVLSGRGLCPTCVPRDVIHTVYYVVSGNGLVKPGITSGNGVDRLSDHSRNGLTKVHMFVTELDPGKAPLVERFVLSGLANIGWSPIRGREYFPETALRDVMRLAGSALVG